MIKNLKIQSYLKYLNFKNDKELKLVDIDSGACLLTEKNITPFFSFDQKKYKTRYSNAKKKSQVYSKKYVDKVVGQNEKKNYFLKKKNSVLQEGIVILILLFLSLYTLLDFYKKNNVKSNIQNLESSFLIKRTSLLNQIHKKLLNSDHKKENYIPEVLLFGLSGSGKTTLSKMYAQQYRADITWNLNAQSYETLIQSYEHLADALAKSAKDKEALSFIKSVDNQEKRVQHLLLFLQNHLKNASGWFFIFDNVTSIESIITLVPQDRHLWGNGNILFATSNKDILSDHLSKEKEYVQVDKLAHDESIQLFCQTLHHASLHQLSKEEQKNIKDFMAYIPCFPLDLVLSAHYLKQTKLKFPMYVEKIQENKDLFKNIKITKNTEIDSTRRQSLINILFEDIIKSNKNFSNLLFLGTFLNFKNIPKKWLTLLKDKKTVDDFILKLKEYSLLTEHKIVYENEEHDMIDFHSCLQKYGDKFFLKTLTNEKFKDCLNKMTLALGILSNSLTQEDRFMCININLHVESFIKKIKNLPSHDFDKKNYFQNLYHILDINSFGVSKGNITPSNTVN